MKQILCIYVDMEIKDYLEKKASEKNMTLSQLVRQMLIEKIIEENAVNT